MRNENGSHLISTSSLGVLGKSPQVQESAPLHDRHRQACSRLCQQGVPHTCAENSCILSSSIFRTVCKNSPSWGWYPSTAAAWKMSRMF